MFNQRRLLLQFFTRWGPMSVEQAASAETLAGAPARRGETRILGPIAVGLALLSAFLTFIVLADLTPISPTHYVVVTLLLSNAATVLLLLGLIVREVWQVVQARRSGRAAARLHDILPGITRSVVIDVIKAQGLAFEERCFTVEEAYGAREAFITSASQVVLPVVSINGRPVGNGAPGLVATALRRDYHRHAEIRE